VLIPVNQKRWFPVLVATAVVASACSKDTAPASSGATATTSSAAAQANEDLQTVTDYKLDMGKIDKYMAAQRNIAMKAKDLTPQQKEAMKAKNDADDTNNDNLDDMAKRIESEPMMASAIKDAGLSPREFALITVSLMQSSMAAGILKMRPNDNQDSLIREMKANPENVKFVQEHEAELTKKQQDMAAEMKRLGVDDM
jgi:hypothetical protein